MSKPTVILCSDLHFSHQPPVARSVESNWYDAMARSWGQVRSLAEKHGLPIIVAGDVFDNWKAPPELINFVIRQFAGLEIFAIPGQHDLPNHSYEDMHRSAYGTLVEAGVIRNIDPKENLVVGGVELFGFPWGTEIVPCPLQYDYIEITVAVVHRYLWTAGHNYHGATDDTHIGAHRKILSTYNVAVFGDNHDGFLTRAGNCAVLNCGGFMARKINERNYQPRIGCLLDDGGIREVMLDVSQDRWLEPEQLAEAVDNSLQLNDLISDLESLGADALNFEDVLHRYLDTRKVDSSVKTMVLEALDKGRGNA